MALAKTIHILAESEFTLLDISFKIHQCKPKHDPPTNIPSHPSPPSYPPHPYPPSYPSPPSYPPHPSLPSPPSHPSTPSIHPIHPILYLYILISLLSSSLTYLLMSREYLLRIAQSYLLVSGKCMPPLLILSDVCCIILITKLEIQ